MALRVFIAQESFWYSNEGQNVLVQEGDTVREGHPMLEGRESLFKVRLDKAKFEHEAKVPPKQQAPPAAGPAKRPVGRPRKVT